MANRVLSSDRGAAAIAGDDRVDDFVDFYPSGTRAKGDFRCAECSYGVFVVRELPRCPMCGQHVWEQIARRPFSRLAD